MTTQFDILLAAANIMQPGDEGAATGGSTTTLQDTANYQVAKYYKKGTLYLRSGANIGKAFVVTAWETQVFSFAAQAAACAAGDLYTAHNQKFPKNLLGQAIWSAINDMGEYGLTSENLMTTIGNQEQYDLPAGVTHVKRVQIARNLVTPLEWGRPWRGWEERSGKLVFSNRPQYTGNKIRLFHSKPHVPLTSDSSVIDPAYNPERLTWKTVWYAAIGARKPNQKDDPRLIETINLAANMVQKFDATYEVSVLGRDARFPKW